MRGWAWAARLPAGMAWGVGLEEAAMLCWVLTAHPAVVAEMGRRGSLHWGLWRSRCPLAQLDPAAG